MGLPGPPPRPNVKFQVDEWEGKLDPLKLHAANYPSRAAWLKGNLPKLISRSRKRVHFKDAVKGQLAKVEPKSNPAKEPLVVEHEGDQKGQTVNAVC